MTRSHIVETMTNVFSQITSPPLALKKTDYLYNETFEFLTIKRVNSYYMENNQKFTWLKHWKGNVFIYENPFTQYGLF